jgi:hypothetical protein
LNTTGSSTPSKKQKTEVKTPNNPSAGNFEENLAGFSCYRETNPISRAFAAK